MELLDYQQTSIDQIELWHKVFQKKAFGLYFEQGLGKTFAALKCAERLYELRLVNRVYIILPTSLQKTWIKELEKSNVLFKPTIMTYGSFSKHKYPVKEKGGPSVETLIAGVVAKSKEISDLIFSTDKTLIIFDESHFLRNGSSNRSKWILKILKIHRKNKVNPWVLSLTGTPKTKDITDWWCQQALLNAWYNDVQLSITAFKLQHCLYHKMKNYEILKLEMRENLILESLSNCTIMLKKEDVVSLPPKLYEVYTYALSKEQKKLLSELRDEAIAHVVEDDVYIRKTLSNMLGICSGFATAYENIFDKKTIQQVTLKNNPKLKLFSEVVDCLPKKFIVYCARHNDLLLLSDVLASKKINYELHHGKQTRNTSDAAIDGFINGKFDVLLTTIQSAFQGLNLDVCSTIIYYSNTVSVLERIQSEDRIHRVTQTQKCTYIDLVGDGAPDQLLLDKLTNKMDDAKAIFTSFKRMSF